MTTIAIDRLAELAGIVSLSTTPREFVRIVQWAAERAVPAWPADDQRAAVFAPQAGPAPVAMYAEAEAEAPGAAPVPSPPAAPIAATPAAGGRGTEWNHPWSDAEDALLINACAAGQPAASHQALLPARTPAAIKARITKLRSEGRMKPQARPVGYCKPPARSDGWTEEEDTGLTRMMREGRSYDDIAAALGRSKKAVAVRRQRLGLAPLPPGRPAGAKPAPAPAVSASPLPPEAAPAAAGLTGRQSRLMAHIDALPDAEDFTPADDLALVEGLANGVTASQIADDLGCTTSDLIKRMRTLRTREIETDRGHATIDGQADLLVVLRLRAARAAAADAA